MHRLTTIVGGLLLATTLAGRAVEEPDKEYVRIYRLIQEADLLRQSRQEKPALEKFNESKSALEKLQLENPDWYAKVVQFRLNYVNDRLKQMAAVAEGVKPSAVPLITPPGGRSTETEQQLATLVAEMTKLRAEKTELETRLREAQLTAATTAGRDLAKAEEKVRGIQRENDLLKADIEQQQKRLAAMVEPAKLDEAQKSLAEATRKLEEQSKTNAALGSLNTVNEQLRKQLADSAEQKNAESEKSRLAQQQVEKLKADLAVLDTQLKQAQTDTNRAALLLAQQQKVAELEKQLLALSPLKSANEQLQKQLTDAEAKRTAQEQSLTRAQTDLDAQKKLVQSLEGKQAEEARKAAAAQKQLEELQKQMTAGTASVQAVNEQLKKQLAAAEKSRVAQEQTLTGAQAEVDAQKKLVASLETKQAEEARKAAAAQRQLEELQKQMTAGTASVQAVNEQLKKQLADAEKSRVAQEQSLTGAQTDLEAQKKLVASLETKQAEEARKAAAAQRQLEELQKQMTAGTASVQAANDQLKKQLADAEAKRTAQEKSFTQAQTDLEAQKKLVASLETKQAEEARKAAAAQRQLEELQKQMTAGTASVQAANEQLKKQLADAEKSRAAQEKALATARKDLAAQEKTLEQAQKDAAQVRKDYEAQQARVKSLESGQTQQTAQVAQAQKELAQLKADNADLQQRLKAAAAKDSGMAAREELARNEAKLRSLQTENDQLKQTLKSQQTQMTSLASRSELEAAQKALAEANKTIAAQEKSQVALDSATQTLRLQTAELKKADAARALAEDRAAGLSKELEKARVDLAAQQSLAADQETERRKQADKLKDNAKEIEKLNKERVAMEARLRELRPGVFPDLGEMTKLEMRAASLKTENDSLRAEIAQQQLRAGRLVDVAQLEAAQNSLAAAHRQMAEQNNSLAQLGSLQAANDNLRRQLTDMARNRDGRSRTEVTGGGSGSDLKAAGSEIANQERLIRQLRSEKDSLAGELEKANRHLVGMRNNAPTRRTVDAAPAVSRTPDAGAKQEFAKVAARVQSLEGENRRLLTERNSMAEELFKSDKAAIAAKDTSKSLGERVKLLEQNAAELKRKLEESYRQPPKPAKPVATTAPGREDVDALRARVATLEAAPVPFTADELKLMSEPTPREALQGVLSARKSAKDYSVEQWPEVSDAERAFNEGRFADAERKYKFALNRDEKSVFLLASVAGAQVEQGRLDDAEKNLQRALALDRDDPASLATLGIVRLHQKRFDEALEVLSRASKMDPKNASTQNFLGVALSQKGQRGPAETALRRAVELQPGNPVAHNNLAVVYATQNPPYLELARWHYQKALTGGHRQNADLEKIIGSK